MAYSATLALLLFSFAITDPCRAFVSHHPFGKSTTTTIPIQSPPRRTPNVHTTTTSSRRIHSKRPRPTSFFALMGIKGFRSWLESTFPASVVDLRKLNTKTKEKSTSSDKSSNRDSNNPPKNYNKATAATTHYSQTAQFDHVLIDMNQLLHVVLRKSRSDGHGLTLLMKELDACLELASPTQSLVLAFDGAPSAAKLATQRSRRLATYSKAQAKRSHFDRLVTLEQQQQQPQGQNAVERQQSDIKIDTTASNGVGIETAAVVGMPLPKPRSKRTAKAARKRRRVDSELRTLCITPATDFMHLAEQALEYWAWQRLSGRNNALSYNRVQVYISPSTVAGEGEVKLLEWIYYQQTFRSDSIAILGGDSDLILEGLSIPLSVSHNVYVLLPEGSFRYLAVSLWEMTRSLSFRLLLPSKSTKNDNDKNGKVAKDMATQLTLEEQITHMRTDLVLLLILNGNDYLPKLRGSSGFNRLFTSYVKVHREWQLAGKADQAYLVHPESLAFQLEFCISFFTHLAKQAPGDLWKAHHGVGNHNNNSSGTSSHDDHDARKKNVTVVANGFESDDGVDQRRERRPAKGWALQQLHNCVEAGYLMGPAEFVVIDEDDEDEDANNIEAFGTDGDWEDNEDLVRNQEDILEDEDDDDDDDEPQIRVRLNLGEPDSEDFYTNEIWYPKGKALKIAKHKLASMALEDLMDQGPENGEIGGSREGSGYEDDVEDDVDEDEDGDGVFSIGVTTPGYSWELRRAVKSKTDAYLYGLLWNLQTYQDGVCADYAYNYGKRRSPTAREVANYFQIALERNKTLDPMELSGNKPFTGPVPAGISCLAALPAPVKYLVPEPYRHLGNETVEGIYAECMDASNNVFDMKRFEQLCNDMVLELDLPAIPQDQIHTGRDESNNHSWTVLSKSLNPLAKSIEPPAPFSERLSKLRPDKRIRMSRATAVQEPRQREIWGKVGNTRGKTVEPETGGRNTANSKKASRNRRQNQDHDADLDHFGNTRSVVLNYNSIEDVPYKVAYVKPSKKKGLRGGKIQVHSEGGATVIPSQTKARAFNMDDINKSKLIDLHSKLQEEVQSKPKPNEAHFASSKPKGEVQDHTSSSTKVQGERNKIQDVNEQDFLVTVDVATRPQGKIKKKSDMPSQKKTSSVEGYMGPVTADGQTALACLKQLEESGYVATKWDIVDSNSNEIVRLRIQVGSKRGIKAAELDRLCPSVYEKPRAKQDNRQKIKQDLAAKALADMVGQQGPWSNLTLKEMWSLFG